MPMTTGRAKGAPYRVLDSYGILTGADYQDSLGQWDGDAKYDRFRQIWLSDSEAAATLALIEWPYLSATWTVEGDDDRAVEFIQSCVFDPMHPQALPWRQLLQEILYYRRLGNMLFERVWFKRPDGLVGSYLSPRPPESIWQWNIDGIRISSVVQQFYSDEGKWTQSAPIEAKDLLHFVYNQEANNVEGTSILRSCWGDFYSKMEARNIRNVLLERSGGVLKMVRKDGRISKGEDDDAVQTARDYLAHQKNYIIESDAYGVEWQPTGMADAIGKAQEVVEYADQSYRRRILADFMNIGRQQSGSRAVASVQESPFWASMVGDALYITGKLRTEWFAPMVRANFGEGVDVPRLSFTDLRAKDGSTELDPLFQAISAGSIHKTPELERYILRRAGAPEVAVEAVQTDESATTSAGSMSKELVDAALSILERRTLGSITTGQARVLLESLGMPDDRIASMLEGEEARSAPAPQREEAREEDVEVEAPEEEEAPLSFAFVVDAKSPKASEGRFWRQPTPLEMIVNLQQMAIDWDQADGSARALLEQFRDKVIADTLDRSRKALAKNRPLTKQEIERLAKQTKYVDEFTRKLSALGNAEIQRGRREVKGELARLRAEGRGPVTPRAPNAPKTGGFNPITTEAETKRYLRSLAQQTIRKTVDQITGAAVDEVVGQAGTAIPNLQAVGDTMTRMSKGPMFAGARRVVATGFDNGRGIEAKSQGLQIATYSTLLDDRVCSACAPLDGEDFVVGSVEYDRNKPPNSDCLSAQAGQGSNQCRCFYVYSWETELATEE